MLIGCLVSYSSFSKGGGRVFEAESLNPPQRVPFIKENKKRHKSFSMFFLTLSTKLFVIIFLPSKVYSSVPAANISKPEIVFAPSSSRFSSFFHRIIHEVKDDLVAMQKSGAWRCHLPSDTSSRSRDEVEVLLPPSFRRD